MQERIEEALRSLSLWRNVIYLPAAGSTNDVAKDLAAQGAPEGTVVVADEQTAGRGRMSRHWLAPPGACLLCSLLFRPELPLTQAQWLTMLCSMAAADAVEKVAGLRVALKWPNDLITQSPIPNPSAPAEQETSAPAEQETSAPAEQETSAPAEQETSAPAEQETQSPNWKKLAGILTETGVTGKRLEFAVVGIGINVNVSPETLPTLAPDATSILAETDREADRVALLAALLVGVEARYERLRAGTSPRAEWAARLATLGQRVDVTTSAGILTGVAESVDEDGALLLRTPDGVLHRLLTGDVTLARL